MLQITTTLFLISNCVWLKNSSPCILTSDLLSLRYSFFPITEIRILKTLLDTTATVRSTLIIVYLSSYRIHRAAFSWYYSLTRSAASKVLFTMYYSIKYNYSRYTHTIAVVVYYIDDIWSKTGRQLRAFIYYIMTHSENIL